MQSLVVDCSYIMASIFPDEASSRMEWKNYDIIVPCIFFLECSNVLYTAFRKKRISIDQKNNYFRLLKQLPVTVDTSSAFSDAVYGIHQLMHLYSLTSYDASYLELAARLHAPIATCDQLLKEACLKEGLVVL